MATYNIVDLWRTLRGLENSYRYYGDVIAGIIQHHPQGENLDFEVRKLPVPGWMNLCLPPMCRRLMLEISDELGFMAGKAQDVKEVVDDLIRKLNADSPPMTEVEFFASELPGTRLLIDMADWDPDEFDEGITS